MLQTSGTRFIKKWSPRYSLSAKFILSIVLTFSLTFGLATLYNSYSYGRLIEETLHNKVRAVGQFVALVSPNAIYTYNFTRLDHFVAQITQDPDVLFAAILDTDNKPLTTVFPEFEGIAAPTASIPEKIRQLSHLPEIVAINFPVLDQGKRLGTVVIGLDESLMAQTVNQKIFENLLIYLSAVVLLSIIIYMIFRFYVINPLVALNNGARRVSDGRLDQMVDVLSADEIGELTRIFNTMMQEISHDREKLIQHNIQLRNLSRAVEQSPVSVIMTDLQGNIEYVNPRFSEVSGYLPLDVIGKNANILKSGQHGREVYDDLWSTIMGGGIWRGELHNRKKDGSLFWEEVLIQGVTDDNNNVISFIAVKEDVTERKQAREKIQKLAFHDVLTGLPNRALFNDHLDTSIALLNRFGTPFVLMYMDLDHFKDVNDSLGHPVGDKLLVEAARRLSLDIRDVDTVARMGGDEFAIIMEGIGDEATATMLASRIIASLNTPYEINGNQIHMGTSMGIVQMSEADCSVETLMSRADIALYRAKEEGRNRYVFHQEAMTEAIQIEIDMINHLPAAIENNELYLHYQPQLDLISGEITGVEALIRWKHPQHGELSPANFIPIIEKRGTIDILGQWVLHQTCKQFKKWQKNNLYFGRIAVNVSAVQLRSSDSIELLTRIIREYNLPLSAFEFEITESVLIQAYDDLRPMMAAAIDQGLRFAIDDFGTGYSSLSHLKQLHVHKIKIDREFIADMLTDSDDTEIVRATIALGHALRMEVVAEGVETSEQAEALRNMKCEMAQGYYFSRPQTANDLEHRFSQSLSKSIPE